MKLLKQLFCSHHFQSDGIQTKVKCSKCNKIHYYEYSNEFVRKYS